MFQLKLVLPVVVAFCLVPARDVLVSVVVLTFCVDSLPSHGFACQRRVIFRILPRYLAVICRGSCCVFFRWGLLATAPVDSWPEGTERIRGMLGSVGCRIYRATPITLRYDRWMDPTPPMLVSAVHSWCVCAMGVSCVSQLLPLPLPAITIFFRHGKKSWPSECIHIALSVSILTGSLVEGN